ncbi:MAG: ABC transporter ATP-binding protein [Chloroflexi bacterium HGW-Chloroflexi-10]|nr:MAG: ABC transporter ATP-binding protein [Chloroflexi bacterium HGW-Chloroflexi-10]
MSTIEIRNLSKSFGRVQALKNISITFEPEKIYGFLGRNGAGKTTLLNIVTNRLFPDQGEVWVDGELAVENDRAQQKIFYMTEKTLHPDDMKVLDAIKLSNNFYPEFDLGYAYQLADAFELTITKKISSLSTGYKSIFKMILTLAANTPIMLFDEPVLGLDPNHREMFYKELITCYSTNSQTVVLSTHLIGEIADLLEEVIIIKNGEIIIAQPIDRVLQMAYTVSGAQENVDRYAAGKRIIREESLGKYKALTIYQEAGNLDKEALIRLGLEITPPRLQELFVSLTN